MANVKVCNRNHYPFKQFFEEENIMIEAGRFIIMDKEKAMKFKGTYFPMEFDAGGRQKPESFKKIEIEEMGEQELVKVKKSMCQACGFIALNAKDLDEHINEKHVHDIIDKKEREKRMKAMQA